MNKDLEAEKINAVKWIVHSNVRLEKYVAEILSFKIGVTL